MSDITIILLLITIGVLGVYCMIESYKNGYEAGYETGKKEAHNEIRQNMKKYYNEHPIPNKFIDPRD